MPFTFWGLFVALLLIVVGYAAWMWSVERTEGRDGEVVPPAERTESSTHDHADE